jgi:hypothetical protein
MMSIHTLSQGSFSKGKDVAEKLNDECIPGNVLKEASEHLSIAEIKQKPDPVVCTKERGLNVLPAFETEQ